MAEDKNVAMTLALSSLSRSTVTCKLPRKSLKTVGRTVWFLVPIRAVKLGEQGINAVALKVVPEL